MAGSNFLLILGSILAHYGNANPIHGGIVEGKVLSSHQHRRQVNSLKTPYMVYIDVVDLNDPNDAENLRHTNCGGVIIGARTVLTAAHCIIGSAQAPYITIVAGLQNLDVAGKKKAQITTAERYVTHSNFKAECKASEGKYEFCANDIALIRTVAAFVFRPSINTAVLAGSRSKQRIDEGWIYGWGMTESALTSGELRKAQMKVDPLRTCERAYGSFVFSNTNWCLTSNNHKSAACPGDSGGPFVVKGVVYGLFVFSSVHHDDQNNMGDCDSSLPSVYINLIKYERWIKENVKKLAPQDFKHNLKFDDGSNQSPVGGSLSQKNLVKPSIVPQKPSKSSSQKSKVTN